MDAMSMIPVNSNSGWGDGGAAAVGAFLGSWFTNQNNPNSNTNVLEAINNVGTTVLQGQAQSNMVATQGFAGLNTVIQQGDAAVTSAVTQSSFQNLNALTQGFAGLNTAILTSSNDNRFALQAGLNEIASKMAECCCETQKAIVATAAATQQMFQNNVISTLQTEVCDGKAKAAQLENQVFLQGSQAAQTQQIINTVLAHLKDK